MEISTTCIIYNGRLSDYNNERNGQNFSICRNYITLFVQLKVQASTLNFIDLRFIYFFRECQLYYHNIKVIRTSILGKFRG